MRRNAVALGLAALLVASAAPALAAPGGDDPASGGPADPVGATQAPPDEQVRLTLPLARSTDALAELVRTRPPGAAPLTTGEVSARFGASTQTRAAVHDYFAAHGLEAHVDATGMFATVATDVATAEQLFATDVVVPPDAPDALTTTAPPVVPAPLAGHVSAVLGLDTVARGESASAAALGPSGPSPFNTGTPTGCAEAIASGGVTPNQLRSAYGIEPLAAAGGTGVRVAVVDFEGWDESDFQAANACFGRSTPTPVTQLVDPVTSPLPAGLETTLDLQVVAAIAPQVERIDLFEGGGLLVDFPALFAAPLDPARYPDQTMPSVLTSSIGQCEVIWSSVSDELVALMESILLSAAAVGVTVLNAAGDHGSSGCWSQSSPIEDRQVWYPASSVWVVAVGGTNVTFAPDNAIAGEVVWNDGLFAPEIAMWGGGGGPSQLFARPGYQDGVGVAGTTRLVPDVAFFADLVPGYAIHCAPGVCAAPGGWYQIGGTSAATPLFATSLALIVQRRQELGLGPLGWFTPTLYDLARTQPSIFRDVVEGTNDLFGVGCCTARVGYDDASGWGSLAVDVLAGVLTEVAPPSGVPEPRFTG